MNFFKKALSGILSECQTVWIQIRPDVLSSLIWVQLFAKVISRRQKSPLAGKELIRCKNVKTDPSLCLAQCPKVYCSYRYEGPAKSFVTGFGLLQCYVLSNIFLLQTFKVFQLY